MNNVQYIKQKTVYENETALYNLLVDHPVYLKRINNGRRNLRLPIDGFHDEQKAFGWTYSSKLHEDSLRKQTETVLKGFKIPEVYFFKVQLFTEDYLLSVKRVKNLLLEEFSEKKWKDEYQDKMGTTIETVREIISLPDRELNKYLFDPNTIYLKISPEMRYNDLRDIYKKIKKRKNTLYPFSIPKPQEISRTIWRMRMAHVVPKDIINVLRRKYPEKNGINNHFVDIYTQRYKVALETLMPLPKRIFL